MRTEEWDILDKITTPFGLLALWNSCPHPRCKRSSTLTGHFKPAFSAVLRDRPLSQIYFSFRCAARLRGVVMLLRIPASGAASSNTTLLPEWLTPSCFHNEGKSTVTGAVLYVDGGYTAEGTPRVTSGEQVP